jgi:CheY-like chemotaxis protein
MINILLIEDDKDDARLMQEAFRDVQSPNTLQVLEDGEKAVSYLRPLGPVSKNEKPDLILLDLNLPKLDGFEVLSAIKEDPALSMIPVIVMSTSNSPKDIRESYLRRANSYIVKPLNLNELVEIAHSIEDYWLVRVSLPPQ